MFDITLVKELLLEVVILYQWLLIIWAICSWFPQVPTTKFYQFIDKLVSPYAKIFRGLIPPVGGFDFSVIIAILVLGFLRDSLEKILGVAL